MTLATTDDVAAALRRELTDDELTWVPTALEEASALIIGYLGCDPTIYDDSTDPPTVTVPDAARLVAARMVARVIEQRTSSSTPVGASSYSRTTGPFGQTVQVQAGANTGGPWLTAVDKITLNPLFCKGRAFAVDTVPTGGGMHEPWCSAVKYRDAPWWYAGHCTCGAYLAGVPTPGVG
jgi:hypothetical protein